jgi:2-dehydropantoate 2-reductase
MRHAVLGAGGVGGLLSAALSRAGFEVVALVRPESLAGYDPCIQVESQVLGDFEAVVPATARLDRDVDVLWVTPKATALAAAMDLAPPEVVKGAVVIPLMNGIDHLGPLRARYELVLAGTLRVASERQTSGRIVQRSPFVRIDLAKSDLANTDLVAGAVAEDVTAAGIECHVGLDEVSLLWRKLVFLAPLALATTAADAALGGVRDEPAYLQAQAEALAVAAAEGAQIDLESLRALRSAAPDTMRSSMQHDVAAGRPPELDAIAGPVQRAGRAHGIPTPATDDLAARVRARAATVTAVVS